VCLRELVVEGEDEIWRNWRKVWDGVLGRALNAPNWAMGDDTDALGGNWPRQDATTWT
jgi:hypothetical protein